MFVAIYKKKKRFLIQIIDYFGDFKTTIFDKFNYKQSYHNEKILKGMGVKGIIITTLFSN